MPDPHPLVVQLRFARSELLRAIDGVSDADSVRRLLPMNSIGWNVGHLLAGAAVAAVDAAP